MFGPIAKFFENLQFNLTTGGLSDIEAFLYYGVIIMVAYYLAIGRTAKPLDMKLHGMVLVAGGAAGVAINRYRKAAFAARVEILEKEGMSKDTAYLAGKMPSGGAMAGLAARR